MKISILRVNNDILLGKKQDLISQFLLKKFVENGEVINFVTTIENHPERMLFSLTNLDSELTIIVGETISSKNFNIKKTLCNYLNLSIVKSEMAVNFVNEYYQKANLPVLFDSENEYYLPDSAELLPVSTSALQSYMITKNNKTYVFIAGELEIAEEVFSKYLINIIKKDLNTQYKTSTIKTFGISEKDIYSILSDLIKNKYKILLLTYPDNLEVSIIIRYNQNLEENIVNDFIVKIYERLNKYIYADEEATISKRAFDLLSVSGRKLAIAETITGGNITSNLMKQCQLNNNLILENIICLDNKSLINRLNVSSLILSQYGFVSVEVAYEMAAGLLESSKADIVLITNGLVDFNNDDKKGKLCFIAVGDSDGIHVYKNTVFGNREQIINSLTQTSFYYLIKNIKQNDLFFDKTTL